MCLRQLISCGLNMKNTWLIIGKGPSVDREGKDKIQALINKDNITAIGINHAPLSFYNVDYWLSLDGIRNNEDIEEIFRKSPDAKFIADRDNITRFEDKRSGRWIRKPYVILHTAKHLRLTKKVVSTYKGVDVIDVTGGINSSLAAIHYAILRGVQNILLIGVEFKNDWSYFEGMEKGTKVTATDRYIESCRATLEKFKEHVNILTLDSQSTLNVPKVDINEYI